MFLLWIRRLCITWKLLFRFWCNFVQNCIILSSMCQIKVGVFHLDLWPLPWQLFYYMCFAVQNWRQCSVHGAVWRLRRNIIRTALCWFVWHNVHSPQNTCMSSSYRSNRLGLSHWDPYAVRKGGCLQLYYCNMVEWFWWDSSLISTTNWFPSVLWHCWFGHLACKNRPRNDL